MLKEKISAFIEKIQSIKGVAACALVSRDGIIAGKYFDRELNEPWFGALSATILASAESIGSITKMNSLESVTIKAQDATVIVMGAGDNFLIAAIVKEKTMTPEIYDQMMAISKKISEAM